MPSNSSRDIIDEEYEMEEMDGSPALSTNNDMQISASQLQKLDLSSSPNLIKKGKEICFHYSPPPNSERAVSSGKKPAE